MPARWRGKMMASDAAAGLSELLALVYRDGRYREESKVNAADLPEL